MNTRNFQAMESVGGSRAVVRKNPTGLYFLYNAKGENPVEIDIPIIPNNVTYDYTPNFSTQNVLGRVTPIYSYLYGSDETYSFTLTLHADMFREELIEVVDKIKMLSYPINQNGITNYPEIYFQLGELAGIVIVDTSIDWKKPIISKHYALVDIGFSLRLTRKFEKLESIIIERDTDTGNIKAGSRVYIGGASRERIEEHLTGRGYDLSITDFVGSYNDIEMRQALQAEAERVYDREIQRLVDIYGMLEALDQTNTLDDLISFAKNPATLRGKDAKKKAKSNLTKYLKKIWDQGLNQDTGITTEESKDIEQGIFDILNNLQRLEEEIEGYGAAS